MDYRDAKTYASQTEAEDKDEYCGNMCWWEEELDPYEACKRAHDMAKSLEQNASERRQANLRHARMYENVELQSLSSSDFATSVVLQAIQGRGLMRRNVVAACEDTLAAKVAKNKPRPAFLTTGGNWLQQQKARRLDRFSRGLLQELKAYEFAKDLFMDGLTFGTGIGHVYVCSETKRLKVERVLPDEIFVDELDALYGSPRTMLRKKFVQREVLESLFPDADLTGAKEGPEKPNRNSLTPMVEVWEAWHINSGKGEKDGRHMIFVDGCCLLSEKWKLDCFPFVVFRFKKRVAGFWGKGVAETLAGIQIELNRVIASISEQLRRKGKGRTWVPMGSKVSPAHLTNGIGDVCFYTGGVQPNVDNSNAVAQEEFMYVESLYRMAFQEVGLSELSVSAKKPAGLDAAVALREFSDIESERFALVHQSWENLISDLITLCLKVIREFGSKGYTVTVPEKRYSGAVSWSDIELEDDDFIIQIFPTSSLPSTPAYRYQKVKEMMADGFIDKATAQRLLDYPDLEREQDLANADIDDVDATISAILDAEEPELRPLEPFQNLDLMISRANASYLYARHHGCPEDRLDMLQQLIEQATAAKVQMMPPPAPGMPGQMAGPPPTPGAEMMPPGAMGTGGGAGLPRIGSNVGNLTIDAAPPVAPAVPPVISGG